MDILRFITAGNVDDGKSTLIGRLLYDSKNILIDQLQAIEHASNKEDGSIDLALLTDGLRAEREQGITIDVAYKYFSTSKRKFIIADAPGHIQYTRNMVTGASNADLIIILIDAQYGVTEQTRRHSIIASLLNIQQVVVAVNKMDLVNYDEEAFNRIVKEYENIAGSLGLANVTYIPLAALIGDNIIERSERLNWYKGPALLPYLEQVDIQNNTATDKARLYVQYVIRPQTKEHREYRGYAGKAVGGGYTVGDEVTVLPSGRISTIKSIEVNNKGVNEAYAGQSIVLQLHDDIDISRGNVIVKTKAQLSIVSKEVDALLCWMDNKPLVTGNRYLLQLNSQIVPAIVQTINYKIDVNTIVREQQPIRVSLNDVVHVTIKTATPLTYDSYQTSHTSGGAILIDETSNLTVAAAILQ